MLVGRNQLPGAVISKQRPFHGTAVSCVSGFWTPLSRPCLESGVRSFSGGITGTRGGQRMGCRNGLKSWGREDTHEGRLHSEWGSNPRC
jgi:hypothetical protein